MALASPPGTGTQCRQHRLNGVFVRRSPSFPRCTAKRGGAFSAVTIGSSGVGSIAQSIEFFAKPACDVACRFDEVFHRRLSARVHVLPAMVKVPVNRRCGIRPFSSENPLLAGDTARQNHEGQPVSCATPTAKLRCFGWGRFGQNFVPAIRAPKRNADSITSGW